MKKSELLADIVNVHNQVVRISVQGDDAITMANVIISLRNIANKLQQDNVLDSTDTIVKSGEESSPDNIGDLRASIT